MQMTPRRQQLIDAHVAETKRLMAGYAFELNDLVRFALAAAQDKAFHKISHKVYYPMDAVNESARNWHAFDRKVEKLARDIAQTAARLGVPPFDAEAPPADDDDGVSDAES